MAINLSDNIKTNAPKPTDSRYLNNLSPWASVAAVNAGISSGTRYTGLTVNVQGVEYWYEGGIGDGDLVVKTVSGGTGTITGATNVGNGYGIYTGITTNNLQFKSFSGTGNVCIVSENNKLTFSGGSGISSVNWGDIGGDISGQTDLQTCLDERVICSDFNTYTGDTNTCLGNIDTCLGTKVDCTDFDTYTGTTDTTLSGLRTDVDTVSGATVSSDALKEAVRNALQKASEAE